MKLLLRNDTKTTSVPNKFIEASLAAPENYIRAYLLGLMYSSNIRETDFDVLCGKLNMDRSECMEAYEFWQKKGFVKIVNSDEFCLEFGDFNKYEEDIYTEREFNQKLQSIFGSRQLSPQEYLKIYDYTDMFRIPKNIVLLLAQYCVLIKGIRVSISYMDKVAKSWAEEDKIDTEEKAKEKIENYKVSASGIMRVLKQLGISGRESTKDELDLYAKWTREWGFTLEAILTACSHTTAAREPSMKYLDRILQRLYEQGSTTSRKITEGRNKSEEVGGNLKELMRITGEKCLKPPLEYESLYYKWTLVYGYGMDILRLAAKHTSQDGSKPLPILDDILSEWYNNRIFSLQDAESFLSERSEIDNKIESVFKAAGILRRPADAHRRAYSKWNGDWSINHDAILLAAEISSLSENPYRYLNALLSNWHESGIRNLRDAQQETKKHTGRKSSEKKGSYFERPAENYDHLAVDLFKDEGA